MTTNTDKLKRAAETCLGRDLFAHLCHERREFTLRDEEGAVFKLERNDQKGRDLAEFITEATPRRVLELIRERDANGRMLVNACAQMGAIGHAMNLDMDADGDEMLGAVQSLIDGMNRIIQECPLGSPGFAIATEVMGELGVRQEQDEDDEPSAMQMLVDDLTVAAETLRRYEGYHRAKGTQESLDKATANQALAMRFEATLAKVREGVGE